MKKFIFGFGTALLLLCIGAATVTYFNNLATPLATIGDIGRPPIDGREYSVNTNNNWIIVGYTLPADLPLGFRYNSWIYVTNTAGPKFIQFPGGTRAMQLGPFTTNGLTLSITNAGILELRYKAGTYTQAFWYNIN